MSDSIRMTETEWLKVKDLCSRWYAIEKFARYYANNSDLCVKLTMEGPPEIHDRRQDVVLSVDNLFVKPMIAREFDIVRNALRLFGCESKVGSHKYVQDLLDNR